MEDIEATLRTRRILIGSILQEERDNVLTFPGPKDQYDATNENSIKVIYTYDTFSVEVSNKPHSAAWVLRIRDVDNKELKYLEFESLYSMELAHALHNFAVNMQMRTSAVKPNVEDRLHELKGAMGKALYPTKNRDAYTISSLSDMKDAARKTPLEEIGRLQRLMVNNYLLLVDPTCPMMRFLTGPDSYTIAGIPVRPTRINVKNELNGTYYVWLIANKDLL
jgi:hypothetical protein